MQKGYLRNTDYEISTKIVADLASRVRAISTVALAIQG